MPPRPLRQASVSPSRWIAYRTLAEWRDGKGFVADLLQDHWEKSRPRVEDQRLSQAIVYGVLRNLRCLDFWIDRLARKGIASLPEPAVDGLRIALFQLAFLDRIPAHAAVSEAAALCDRSGLSGMKGVVNGMLRSFPARREELDRELATLPDCLGIETSHPEWLVDWAIRRWGTEKGALWLRRNNLQPALHLRPVACRLLPPGRPAEATERERAAARALLDRMGEGELTEDGTTVKILHGGDPAQIEAVRAGLANVQDLSAQQAARLLDPNPGETVYDLCAAPGGKAVQIADRTADRARLIAVDLGAERLSRVEENLKRCGFTSFEIICRDLTEPWNDPPAWADGVLLDAPCSGLGTLRRKVDLRYRIGPRDIEELAAKSALLLENASRLVKPGGRLVYSTCTLTEEETRGVVEGFVYRQQGLWKLIETQDYPDWLRKGEDPIPEEIPDCDGAFVALLVRPA